MIILLTIWLLHTIALMVPGANVLLISYLAASGKATTAIYASIGIAVGAAIWATAAVLGINSLFNAFPQIRLFIQIIGVFYLLYVATRLWHTQTPSPNSVLLISKFSAFRQGLLVNLTNPKAAIFFGSIFSATLPTNPNALLLLAAVFLIVVNCLCWHVFLSYFFSKGKIQSAYSKYAQVVNRVAGSIFGTLGLYILVTTFRETRK